MYENALSRVVTSPAEQLSCKSYAYMIVPTVPTASSMDQQRIPEILPIWVTKWCRGLKPPVTCNVNKRRGRAYLQLPDVCPGVSVELCFKTRTAWLVCRGGIVNLESTLCLRKRRGQSTRFEFWDEVLAQKVANVVIVAFRVGDLVDLTILVSPAITVLTVLQNRRTFPLQLEQETSHGCLD